MLYWPPWQSRLWSNPGMPALHGLTFGDTSAFRPQQNVTAVIPCRKLKVNAPRLVQVEKIEDGRHISYKPHQQVYLQSI